MLTAASVMISGSLWPGTSITNNADPARRANLVSRATTAPISSSVYRLPFIGPRPSSRTSSTAWPRVVAAPIPPAESRNVIFCLLCRASRMRPAARPGWARSAQLGRSTTPRSRSDRRDAQPPSSPRRLAAARIRRSYRGRSRGSLDLGFHDSSPRIAPPGPEPPLRGGLATLPRPRQPAAASLAGLPRAASTRRTMAALSPFSDDPRATFGSAAIARSGVQQQDKVLLP
jgi:hypothetical protein